MPVSASSRYRSGQCPVCGFRARMTRTGLIATHRLYPGYDDQPWRYCEGALMPPAHGYIREGGRRVYF